MAIAHAEQSEQRDRSSDTGGEEQPEQLGQSRWSGRPERPDDPNGPDGLSGPGGENCMSNVSDADGLVRRQNGSA